MQRVRPKSVAVDSFVGATGDFREHKCYEDIVGRGWGQLVGQAGFDGVARVAPLQGTCIEESGDESMIDGPFCARDRHIWLVS